jgi:hypothetical protein
MKQHPASPVRAAFVCRAGTLQSISESSTPQKPAATLYYA